MLILEDHPDDEALILRALQSLKPAPSTAIARDGVEGLQGLQAPETRLPDLVLVDLNMPRMTGFVVLRAVRSDPRFRHLPLVVFTSSGEAGDVQRAYDAGATAYVEEPTEYGAFSNALQAVVRFWLGTNEPATTVAQRLQRVL